MRSTDAPTAARPRRWLAVAALATAALAGTACTSGGGSSREDIINTLTDEQLDDPLSTDQAGCAYDRLREEFGDDLGDVTGRRAMDDDDAELVTRVSQIVQACVSGSGPQPGGDTDSDDTNTDVPDTDDTTGDDG